MSEGKGVAVRRVILAIMAGLSAVFAVPAAAETNNMLAVALDSITADELYEHVQVLADDVYEGRAAGSRGGHAASQYIIKQLREYTLTPGGTADEFVQRFSGDSRNILAILPGNDPELEREVIVVGAHYDHVGYGSRTNSLGPIGRIHNGADDNASGTSMLLETIEAFSTSGIRTRRTILFAFWDAEERGLVGSRYWLVHPTVPAERVKFAVNLDMVGRLRNNQLYVLGTRSGYGLRRLMSGPVEEPLQLNFSWELAANSDHWSFLEHRIPIALIHTGLHSDYHRPSDDTERINREGMREVGRYVLAALIKLANEDRLPAFRGRVTRETESGRRALERPLAQASLDSWPANLPRPRLGIAWREDEAEPGAVFLTRVVPSTPAAAADMRVGDRIYELNGQPFSDANAFQTAILSLLDTNPPEISFFVERNGHERTATVRIPAVSQEPKVESQGPENSPVNETP